jgi:hypothetical protein
MGPKSVAQRAQRDHRYRGYTIERGSYTGTHQDRADRWYVDGPSGLRDRSGEGYHTLDEAKAAIDDREAAR